MKPHTLTPWRQYLAQLSRATVEDLYMLTPVDGWCDIFTDGSCLQQSECDLRMAGWSIIQAAPSGDVKDATVIGCGPLPGLLQSSFRAELHAVMLSIEAAVVIRCGVRIWTDSEAVLKGVKRMCQRGRCCRPNHPHYDLWKRIYVAVQVLGWDRVIITHVDAHTDGSDDAFSMWAAAHNSLADRQAVLVNRMRPSWVMQLWNDHLQQTNLTRRINREVQRAQLQVSVASFRAEKPQLPPAAVVLAPVVGRSFSLVLTHELPHKLVQKFSMPYLEVLHGWLSSVLQHPSYDATKPVWMSSYQLFVDWNIHTGHPGCASRQLDHDAPRLHHFSAWISV